MVSDALGGNSVAGINSSGNGNIYADNLFMAGNAVNFINGGSGDDVVAYKGSLNASGQNYFYPPLIDNQHTITIVNGLGRYDLYDSSTGPIDNVQSEYNAAISANPGDVIVLHLNGTYTVGSKPLTLSSDTCVLLGGTIQINSSTTASCAVTANNGASYISISGGTIDGGTSSPPSKGRDAIYFSGIGMFQIDAVTMQHFGNNSSRVGGSDVVRIDHGSSPRIVTRCTVNGGSARGIWLATSGPKNVVSDNTVTDVQMDGVDCDESTSASLVKFNYLRNNSRYGVFLEQSASDNCILGNVCNYNSSYDIGCYNNSSTPRGATAYNSIICNSLLGGNGLRNGSTGDGNSVTSSDNFFFNNTVINANIQSQLYGTQNYYSQNYLSSSSLSTSGTEVFFNSPDVSGNLQIQDSNSGLDAVVQNAAITNGAPVVTGNATGLGNDLWQLIPSDSGYYRLMNENSGKVMVVLNASTNSGAGIIQYTYNASGNDEWMPVSAGNGLYNFINRLSGLYLDVAGASTAPGTSLNQQPSTGGANQQFNLVDTSPPVTVSAGLNTVSWTSGGAPDGNWNNAANWGGTLPQTNDWLGFGSGFQLLTTNNFSAGTTFGNLVFDSSAASFTLNGNSVVLAAATQDTNGIISGGGIADASVNNQTINLPVTLSAGSHVIATVGGAGSLALSGPLTRNSGTTVQFNVSGGAILSRLGISNGIVGGWAVFSPASSLINNGGGAGSVDWATTNAAGAMAAYSAYTTVSGSGQTIAGNSSSNAKVTSNGASDDKVNSGMTTINTLVWSSTTQNGYIDIPASATLRLGAQGGILHNDNKYLRIGNGQGGSTVTAGGADNTAGELSIYNLSYYAADVLEFWTTLADNGSGAMAVNTFGSVKIDNANTYSGGTCINAGTLALSGSGSISNSAVITIAAGATLDVSERSDQTLTLNSGQTLQGGGTVDVNLTVGQGAEVVPGNSLNTGTLTVAGAAQLQGATFMKLNAGSDGSDQINASSFSFGGTLTVTNLAGTLVAGQSFQLFLGDSYSGSFSAINLPPLASGLAWDTNNLTVSGLLRVISLATSPPDITSIELFGTNLMIGGTNASAGMFYLLMSTNLATPFKQWQTVATNTFGGAGSFSLVITNAVIPNASQQYYILSSSNHAAP